MGLRVESLAADGADLSSFESVRDRVGLYAGVAPEPVAGNAHCMIAWHHNQPRARCSLMVGRDLCLAPGLTGMIGHYEALDRDAGVALLGRARDELVGRGAARVVGPMNGSTWARYRLALPSASGDPAFDPPHFLTEPRNPFEYPAHFAAAGFEVVSRYESRIDPSPDDEAPDARAVAGRVASAGIRIRPLDLARFNSELGTLFTISLAAFGKNPFYAPLDEHTFRGMYESIRPIVDPGLVFIAEDSSKTPVGFAFTFLDPHSRGSGRSTRVIFKTIALMPEVQGRGLAAHIFDLIRRAAAQRGCGAVVHALMHATNTSLRLSARHGTQLFRRYALYQWTP